LIRINGDRVAEAHGTGMDHWSDAARACLIYLIVLAALMVGALVWNGGQLPRTALAASEVSDTGEP